MAIRTFFLDIQRRSYYRNRDGGPICFSCDKKLVLGDKVVSHTRGSGENIRRVLRCLPCAERMYLI